jgi:Sel1 repeat
MQPINIVTPIRAARTVATHTMRHLCRGLYTFFALWILLTSLSSARADTLDDNLQTVWESLWDQRGTPLRLSRWKPGTEPIRYRVFGLNAESHKKDIQRVLDATTASTGLAFSDVSDAPDAAQSAQIAFEIFKDIPNEPSFACLVRPVRFDGWNFAMLSVQMRSRDVWSCAHHEVMHAMGIPGHPSGKTVLSYFRYRQDQLADLDRVMLQAWYSPEMEPGATAFKALPVLAKYVVKSLGADRDATEMDARVKQFLFATVQSMENFAQGKGEVPTIVRRSGLASENHIANARKEIAMMLGSAYSQGDIVAKSYAAATQWYVRAADAGHDAGQFAAGMAYFYGSGVAQDKTKGYRWLVKAAATQKTFFKDKLAEIEKALPVAELEQLRQGLKE